MNVRDAIIQNPIIAAVKTEKDLDVALKSDAAVIFILFGDICTIGPLTDKIKQSGKFAAIHLDLIDGLSPRDISVDFIKKSTSADCVISTRPSVIKRANELGICSVQRFFVLDSIAIETMKKQLGALRPDFVEILPGVIPKVIKRIVAFSPSPLIAGGLITDKEDITLVLDAGACAISSTNQKVWEM